MSVRGVLATRVRPVQAVVVVVAFAVALKLAVEGDVLAAWGVVLLAAMMLWVLWLAPRLRRPARTVHLEETTVLRHTCEVVWGLIKPAELAPLLDPNLRFGYRVPGTPDGLGERQALEQHDGSTLISEVIEYEPYRRAVTCLVSPHRLDAVRSFQTVEPLDEGCRYTMALEVDLKAGTRVAPQVERSWRDTTRDHFARVRAILDSGEPITAPTRDTAAPGPVS
ncbi:MAG: hypothetical protein WCC60_09730 [Ilumatobacteraceae bacterium]